MNITKREFEVISLYARGLTFKEMAYCLNIAERTATNYLMRVQAKDKAKIKRSKQAREINKQKYTTRLKEVIRQMRAYNNEIERYGHTFIDKLSIKEQSRLFIG